MKSPFTKSLLIGSSLCLGIGSLVTMGVVTIPTQFGSHEAKLSELHLGSEWVANNPVVSLDTNNNVLVNAGGLIAGESSNKNQGTNSTIAGGGENTITATNATIGAGRKNNISGSGSTIGAGRANSISAEGAFIGAGETNTVQGKYSTIAGGRDNTVGGSYSVVVGGGNNKVSANYSVALGSNTNISHQGTFAWSDENLSEYGNQTLNSQKTNTFLIRSTNGMGINTNTSIAGVNVVVNGSTLLGGTSKLLSTANSCTANTQGTMEIVNGCYYFCDGKFWQVVNLPFEGDNVPENCAHNNAASKTCYLDGFELRAGDTMEAYNTLKSTNCASVKTTVTCKLDGTLDKPSYKYANCLPA